MVNRQEIIDYMVKKIQETREVPPEFGQLIWERENFLGTDLVNNIAFPHPSQVVSEETFIAVALLQEPVLWEKRWVKVVILVFIFFRQNIKSFPKELVEAARIDGLGELTIFFRIFVPINKHTYAAAAIITFMGSWNSYLWPLVALQSPEKRTLPLILSVTGASYTPHYGMMMCGIVLSTLPTAILFFMMQKQFVQGMIGSVK